MSNNRCIFCKSADRDFTSCEHIVPESLGNKVHVLPPGIVCDWCNNYFARKVEAPILNTPFFKQARSRNGIPNKRNRLFPIDAIAFPVPLHMQLMMVPGEDRLIYTKHGRDNVSFKRLLDQRQNFSVILPVAGPPEARLMARFLAMMALEAWAKKLLDCDGDLDGDLIDKPELDELRSFARFGAGVHEWPFADRRLYPEGHSFREGDSDFEILHEYTLLYTESNELYFVIAILGTEFAINLGGPEIDGYQSRLSRTENKSPLYP